MIKRKPVAHVGEIVYGVHPLRELLKAKQRKVLELYTLKPEPKVWKEIAVFLPKYPITIHHLSREQLSHKAGTTDHQGVVALVAPFAFRKSFFNPSKEPFLVLLDGVQDVRNFGAIIRTAYCTGVNGIIICTRQAAPLSGAALKASAGLAERMPIFQASSVAHALQLLKESGYAVYVTAVGAKQDATALHYQKPLCVIIGSEGKGVSPEALKLGTVITLPQSVKDVSYNASVAAGIILFMIAYQKS